MRVIARRRLRAFWKNHADAEQPLKAWFTEARKASWKKTNDIKADYASASFLAKGRVVFHIKGNTYRLVVAIKYDLGIVYIRFVGTHAGYDKIDAETI